MNVKIYSDGSSRGNPGKGGYGTIVHYLDDKDSVTKTEEFTKGFCMTTNNRMEILGAIIGIESVKSPAFITIYSDSQYLVNTFEVGWIWNWVKKDWKNSSGKDVLNKDLWIRMLDAIKPHKVKFVWVKGHAGHPENERCDWLATASADGKNLVKGKDGKFTEIKESEKDKKEGDVSV